MLKKIFKFIIGVALVPVVIAAALCFYAQIGRIRIIADSQGFFIWGVISYILLDLLLVRPKAVYVFGHEATHALFTWIFGGKVKNLKASSKGGSVQTSKTNFIISLAPYFIPFYTLIACLLYLLFSLFMITARYSNYLLFIIGFTLVYHIVLTVDSLKVKQTDLSDTGYVFSLALIILMNIIILALIISGMFRQVDLKEFFIATAYQTRDFYVNSYNYLFMFR